MTKAEILKKEILRQYRSVRQFAMEMNIPYSTLVTALERGIEGMAYGTVIKMCDKLSLNPVDFSSLERDASLGAQLLENRVIGAAYFDTWQWFNLSNTLCYVIPSFSYVLLRLNHCHVSKYAAPYIFIVEKIIDPTNITTIKISKALLKKLPTLK